MTIRCYLFEEPFSSQLQWYHEREDGKIALLCFISLVKGTMHPPLSRGHYVSTMQLDGFEKGGKVVRLD